MKAKALYGQADDNYESFVVAVYTSKRAAKRAMKRARKADKYHRPGRDYWQIESILLNPSWKELAASRWELQ